MRISGCSSDVCSSDLLPAPVGRRGDRDLAVRLAQEDEDLAEAEPGALADRPGGEKRLAHPDRISVVPGKSVSVSVELGGPRLIQSKNNDNQMHSYHMTVATSTS